MALRPAAELLLREAKALEPILRATPQAAYANPTVCDGWSVFDVMAHCAAALTRTATGDLHSFSPEDNQADVEERRGRTAAEVRTELMDGYRAAAVAIDAAGGPLDGIGLGEWMHGGDIREALGRDDAYVSDGIDLAIGLLAERSRRENTPAMTVVLPGQRIDFGMGRPLGTVTTDAATFVRMCGGRRPDPARYEIGGSVDLAAMVLFS